ncbi:MAG: Na+/H+ antiporter NhaC family protein [Anaerovoracaceae bacterium]
MDMIIAFIIFMGTMITCIVTGTQVMIALVTGLVCFLIVGIRRGFTLREVSTFALRGSKDSLVVIYVMLLIGLITAIWRSSGTITAFVYYGIKVITPSMFIFVTFILASILAYALGTSFGVVGTVGVIFMALARSGGVNEILTAGAIMSGIYFGDRTGPASSSGNLVAIITGTKMQKNVRAMLKTGALPMVISGILYYFLSINNPIKGVDAQVLGAFKDEFVINYWLFIPAILMIVLPLLRVDVMISLSASILAGAVITVVIQGNTLMETINYAVFGYTAKNAALTTILSGGGIISMIEVCGIVIISCAYSGLFNNTNMLSQIQSELKSKAKYIGRFGAMLVVSTVSCMVFCNQTVASMMCNDLLAKPYEEAGATKEELAIDIENSVIVIAGLVPWCLACSFPLKAMGVGINALPFSFFVYLMPICYAFTKKIWYNKKDIDQKEI